MASQFLLGPFPRFFRPIRSRSCSSRGIGTNALLRSSGQRCHLSSASVSSPTGFAVKPPAERAATATLLSPRWGRNSGQPFHTAHTLLTRTSRDAAFALSRACYSSSSSSSIRNSGAVRLSVTSSAATLPHGCSRREPQRKVLPLPLLMHQVGGRRFLGSRKTSRATLINKDIKAAQFLLVWETKDGSKEKKIVTRAQALQAAKAANLDLVQVSSSDGQVVCRLMDFKREEYRKLKQKKSGARKPRKIKEMRLRGMIASHDFERKVNTVKKYLERGDVVKVVMEANTYLLRRSGNCLNELQENFEAAMQDFDGVVMKPSQSGEGYTRREVECHPKAVKPVVAKAEANKRGTPDDASAGSVAEAEQEGKPKLPARVSGFVDEEVVCKILEGPVEETSTSPDSDTLAGEGSEDGSEESSDDDSSSDDEELESSLDDDEEHGEVFDSDFFNDAGDGDELLSQEIEREKREARRREDRRRQEEAKERARLRDAGTHSRRRGGGGGGGGKRIRTARSNDDSDVPLAEMEEGLSLDDRREKRSRARGLAAGVGRGEKGAEGAQHRRGAQQSKAGGTAPSPGEGGFGFSRAPGLGSQKSLKGRAHGGRSDPNWQGDGELQERGGRGNQKGARWASPSDSPARPVPKYKWRTSVADGAGASPPRKVPAKQQPRNPPEAARWSRQDRGGRGASGDADGVEIRGFRDRFGAGFASNSDREGSPRGVKGSGPRDSAGAEAEAAVSSSKTSE